MVLLEDGSEFEITVQFVAAIDSVFAVALKETSFERRAGDVEQSHGKRRLPQESDWLASEVAFLLVRHLLQDVLRQLIARDRLCLPLAVEDYEVLVRRGEELVR